MVSSWCFPAMAGLVEFRLEGLVGGLEGQYGSDASQVEAVVEESADLAEADEVVVTVATGATLAAGRIDEAPRLVEPEVLRGAAHQFGGYGDPVEAPAGIGRSSSPGDRLLEFGKTTCIGHGLQGITNL